MELIAAMIGSIALVHFTSNSAAAITPKSSFLEVVVTVLAGLIAICLFSVLLFTAVARTLQAAA